MANEIEIPQRQGNADRVTRKITPDAGAVLRFDQSKKLTGRSSEDYSGTGSYQPVAQDLNLGASAGNTIDNPKFIAPFMGNLLGASLNKAGAYLAGLIGAFSVTGAKASHWPTAGVLGIAMDGVTDVDGVVVAHLDGSDPSAITTPNAAFKAMQRNTQASSGYNYGTDYYHPNETINGDVFFGTKLLKAIERTPNQVTRLEGSGVPVDGVSGTGAGFAGKGSQYVDYTNANIYINANTTASPTWKLVTRAA